MKKLELAHSLSDIYDLLDYAPTWSKDLKKQAVERQKNLLKPSNSLGQLEDIAVFLSSWGKETMKDMEKTSLFAFTSDDNEVMAGDTIVVPIKSSYQTPLNLYSTVSQVVFQSIASIAAFSTILD